MDVEADAGSSGYRAETSGPDSSFAQADSATGIHLGASTVVVFLALNLILVAVCLLILRHNHNLRNELTGYEALLMPEHGELVPPITGLDWAGNRQTISYGLDPRPTLIYMFSMECPYCRKNWHAMRVLQAAAPQSIRFVYVDTVGDVFTPEYIRDNGIGSSPLLIFLSPSVRYTYQARLMPQLLLVDKTGRVQWSHIGELAPRDESMVLALIGNR